MAVLDMVFSKRHESRSNGLYREELLMKHRICRGCHFLYEKNHRVNLKEDSLLVSYCAIIGKPLSWISLLYKWIFGCNHFRKD